MRTINAEVLAWFFFSQERKNAGERKTAGSTVAITAMPAWWLRAMESEAATRDLRPVYFKCHDISSRGDDARLPGVRLQLFELNHYVPHLDQTW